MTTRALSAGLGTGVLVLAACFYPLYLALPGDFVADWPARLGTLGLALGITGAIVIVIGGVVAAHWPEARTRGRGAQMGALAGAIAGVMLFGGLGAAAAGIVGVAEILEHGSQPASGDAQFSTLLTVAVTKSLWLTYIAFWGTILGGALLGALGGLLAPPREGVEIAPREDQGRVTITASVTAMLTNVLILVATVAIFGPVADAVAETAAEFDVQVPFPVAGVFNWPVASLLVMYLASMGWTLIAIRALPRSEAKPSEMGQAAAAAYVTAALAPAVIILLILIAPASMLNPILIVGGIVALVLAWLALQMGIGWSRELRATQADVPRRPVWHGLLLLGYGIGAVVLLIALSGAGSAWGIPVFLVAVVGFFVLAGVLTRRLPSANRAATKSALEDAVGFLRRNPLRIVVSSGLALWVPSYLGSAVSLNLVLGPVVTIPMLASFDSIGPPDPTIMFSPAEVVRTLYTMQALVALGGQAIVFIILAISIWPMIGLLRLMSKVGQNRKPA